MTPRQRDCLVVIRQYWHIHGCGPTMQEIADGLGLKSVDYVSVLIKALEGYGYVKRDKGKQRSIRIAKLPEGWPK